MEQQETLGIVGGNVDDGESYRTWCMGVGMVVVTPDPDAVVKVAAAHGVNAKPIGLITKESGIKIKSLGAANNLSQLEF